MGIKSNQNIINNGTTATEIDDIDIESDTSMHDYR